MLAMWLLGMAPVIGCMRYVCGVDGCALFFAHHCDGGALAFSNVPFGPCLLSWNITPPVSRLSRSDDTVDMYARLRLVQAIEVMLRHQTNGESSRWIGLGFSPDGDMEAITSKSSRSMGKLSMVEVQYAIP
jgi:hypothetical protein